VGMGLAISASVRTEDQATSFIPLALLPQLLFAGALVPIATMGKVGEFVSAVMFERWAFAGAGSGLDMNGRIADDKGFSRFSRYGKDFFELDPAVSALILCAFIALMFGLAWLLVRRRQSALQ
jgi:ABC transport system ATP-binding/permease protein